LRKTVETEEEKAFAAEGSKEINTLENPNNDQQTKDPSEPIST
jgi:hypothetical protein